MLFLGDLGDMHGVGSPLKGDTEVCFSTVRINLVLHYIYIYIYAFSRRFYPKRLTIAFRLYIFNQCMCSLGIEPTTFCAADAMLYHWATQEHVIDITDIE